MFSDPPRDWIHATVVEAVIDYLLRTDSVVMPEERYDFYGARGVIDISRFAPTFMSGCRTDLVEVETRISDVNALIRKVRERGLIFPKHLLKEKQMELGQITSWLVLLATQENAEVVLEYSKTFATLFGIGTRIPQADGVRYGLCFADPISFSGLKPLALAPLMDAGTLEETLGNLCRYNDKADVERELLRLRRGEQTLEMLGVRRHSAVSVASTETEAYDGY